MRKLAILIFVFFTLSAMDIVERPVLQQMEDTQAKMKATYIYSLSKGFEWTTNKEGNFSITVLGKDAGLMTHLNNIANGRTINGRKIEVRSNGSVPDLEKCNVLYITSEKSNLLAEVLSKFKGKGVLIITDKPGLAKVGAVLNFIVKDNKLQYELNKVAAKQEGLNVGSMIEKQANNIY
ncbi:MAG: YfiR family protein [Bacteroidetes bacterium]|nr:YfiR family protein [Bacteroidota bacterium]